MLTLPIKKKWFYMILSGEKKEEYREIKPYYISRFMNLCGIKGKYNITKKLFRYLISIYTTNQYEIRFRNGYSKTSPSFIAKCTLSIGTGKEEWGAEKGKEYFVLTIHEILK
ncbi:MAG: ASCH domain-containing protein [Clostridium sp.]|nr:ASCH domain-containing protein [Clostridium sp.]